MDIFNKFGEIKRKLCILYFFEPSFPKFIPKLGK